MSVEKFIVSKESSNFTIISNKVIQGLKNKTELLGFYIYLLSLPPDWTFYKTQLKEDCCIGVKKLERFLGTLVQIGLVHIAQTRVQTGRFAHFELRILNGELFNINILEKCTPCVNYRTSVNGRTDMGSYKRNINKKNNKQKNTCASGDARVCSFDEFWKTYPLKKNKKRAKEIWIKCKCDQKSSDIIDDVNKRINFEWAGVEKRYIPHASTYLANQRWEDEIVMAKSPSNAGPKQNQAQQTRCAVPEYTSPHDKKITDVDKQQAKAQLKLIKEKLGAIKGTQH